MIRTSRVGRNKKSSRSPSFHYTRSGAGKNTMIDEHHEINAGVMRATKMAAAVKSGLVKILTKRRRALLPPLSLEDLAYVINGHRRLAGILSLGCMPKNSAGMLTLAGVKA